MQRLRLAAFASLLAGLGLIAYAVMTGEARVGLLLIIPFLIGTGPASALGMLLLFAAFVLWSLSAFRMASGWQPDEARNDVGAPRPPAREEEGRRVKHGGVVLLGPIPIVWGSDRRILPWMVGAGALLLLLAVGLQVLFRP